MKLHLALITLTLLVGAASAQEFTVKLPEVEGVVGATVDVPVVVENAKDLGSMDIAVSFDPEILKVKSVGKGELNKGLLSSNTGEGVVAISLADSKGINGDGEVAVITFEILKAGTSELTIQSVKAYNVDTHIDIMVNTVNGKIVAKEGSAAKSTPGFEVLAAALGIGIGLALRGRVK